MIDRTTKLILLLIALGLFANALAPLFHPAAANAQAPEPVKCRGAMRSDRIGGYFLDFSCR